MRERVAPSSRNGPISGHVSWRASYPLRWPLSKPRRPLQLIEPIKPHLLDDPVVDHDQSCLACRAFRIEMLMHRERRDVDEIPARPFELLRLDLPIPFESVDAVEFQVPVQVIAGAFGNEDHLFPHVSVLTRALARF